MNVKISRIIVVILCIIEVSADRGWHLFRCIHRSIRCHHTTRAVTIYEIFLFTKSQISPKACLASGKRGDNNGKA